MHVAISDRFCTCTAVGILGGVIWEIKCGFRIGLGPLVDLVCSCCGDGWSQRGCGTGEIFLDRGVTT